MADKITIAGFTISIPIFILILLVSAFLLHNYIAGQEPQIVGGAAEIHVFDNEPFRINIIISNPTDIQFQPFVRLNYNSSYFTSSNYELRENQLFDLSTIPAKQEKSYFFELEVKRYQPGRYPSSLELYYPNETMIDVRRFEIVIEEVIK